MESQLIIILIIVSGTGLGLACYNLSRLGLGVKLPKGYICIPKEAWDEQLQIEHDLTQKCDRLENFSKHCIETMSIDRAHAVDNAFREYAKEWKLPTVKGPFSRELVIKDIIEHADRLLEMQQDGEQ